MSDDKKYIPGSFYRTCDQTGFKVRSGHTKKQWNGLIVRKESWEARNPQDLVKGIADYQNVPEPRPRPTPDYIDISTFSSGLNPAGSYVLNVLSSLNFFVGDRISIILDDTNSFITEIGNPVTPTTLTLVQSLPYSASNGNYVLDWTSSQKNYQNPNNYPPSS
jgi:hypothetical protein